MTTTGGLHDFDFLAGSWSVHNRSLRARGVDSPEWDEFDATSHCRQYLGGVVNVDEFTFPTKGSSGLAIRAFDLQRSQWSIWWVSSELGTLLPPVVGGFDGDDDDGRPIRARFVWTKEGPNAARWEQAFSYDRETWETNWIMSFTRVGGASCTV